MPSTTLTRVRRVLAPYEGKAVRTPVNPTGSALYGSEPQSRRLSSRQLSTYLSSYGGDNAIDWVMDCVRLIMETTSSANYYFQKDGKRLLGAATPLDDPKAERAPQDLVDLLEQPNPWCDYVELLELLVIDLLLAGNGYWLKHAQRADGRPLALYRISPALIEPVPGDNELIAAYEYRPPGRVEPIIFTPDQLVHFRLPNPHSSYKGLSIIAGAPRVYDIELALVETQARFFERGTKLSGVLHTDRRVADAVFQKIKRQFFNLYSGHDKAYEVAVLEQGLRFQPIQPTAAEAQFEILTKLSMQRVCQMFRVPPPLLGNMDQANYKMQEAQRVFDTKTMRPLLDKLQKQISHALTELWGVDFKIDYQYVMPEEDKLRLATEFATLPGVRVKEVRQKVDLPALGDNRDDIVLNLPTPATPTPHIGPGGGRPPNPGNVPAFPQPGQPDPSQPQPTPAGKALGTIPRRRPEIKDPLAGARAHAVARVSDDLQAVLRSSSLALEHKIQDALTAGEGKAAAHSAASRVGAAATWSKFGADIQRALERTATTVATDAVLQNRTEFGLEVPFDPSELQQLGHDLSRRPDAKGITATLRDRIATALDAGREKGETGEQLATRARVALANWRLNQGPAIAVTEAGHAYNEGTLFATERAGIDSVVVSDGDQDEPCAQADGQIWTVERARAEGLEHTRCTRGFVPNVEGVNDANPATA